MESKLEKEDCTFIEKHFSKRVVTWNQMFVTVILGKYGWLMLIVSTVLAIYIKSVMDIEHESIISAMIFLSLTSFLYTISKYASFITDKRNKRNKNIDKLNSELDSLESRIYTINTQLKNLAEEITKKENKKNTNG